MIKLDYDQLVSLARTQLCAEHHTEVVVAWYGQEKCWTLRCGHDHYPDALVRNPTLTDLYRQGVELPEPIKSNVEKGIRRRSMSRDKTNQANEFALLPKADLATGELLLPEKVQALVAYAHKYGLDPYRGHVVVMYGEPYIGLDGYMYHALTEKVEYQLKSRPLTTVERTEHQINEGDHAWIAFLDIGRGEKYFNGLGIVTREEMTAMSTKNPDRLRSPVVAAHPWQLAQKRAEWQAMRRGFPIGEAPPTKEEEDNAVSSSGD